MSTVDRERYLDLVFKAICKQLTPEERIELDAMKVRMVARIGKEPVK